MNLGGKGTIKQAGLALMLGMAEAMSGGNNQNFPIVSGESHTNMSFRQIMYRKKQGTLGKAKFKHKRTRERMQRASRRANRK